MYKDKWEFKQVAISVVSCIVIMLLVFSMFCSFTLSWLLASKDSQNTGTTNLATIQGGITTSENVAEITMPQVGSYASLSSSSTIKNEGSIDALVRVFYSFVINEETKQIATTNDFSAVNITSGFIASEENIDNVYSGYYFYNKLLGAGESVNFINTVYPTSTIAGQTVKFNIYCELVNYQGGPYQLSQELPWKNTPASWFLNYDNLTKEESSLVSPKLDIKFSEISKLEITAKTNTTTLNGLVGRYDNAYIGINGSSWTFNQLNGATISLVGNDPSVDDVSEFCDGNFHTAIFKWTSCTALTDDYISLAWNTTWSKEISYKQIRVWNTSGELVYDLRPNTSMTNFASTSDGKFINKADNSVLPMYTFSDGVATSSDSVYEYMGRVLYFNGFEDSADGSNNLSNNYGAINSVVSNVSKNGSKSLKISNSLDIDDVTEKYPAKAGLSGISAKAGYKYNISVWFKTTAPEGTMAYKNNSGLIGVMPGLEISGQAYYMTNLYEYGDWTLLSVTVNEKTEDFILYVGFIIPTGTSYTTYIDDISVCIVE